MTDPQPPASNVRASVLFAGLVILTVAALRHPLHDLALSVLHVAQDAGPAGGIVYVALYVAACVLMVPGTLLTLGAGFLYGTLGGMLVVLPGAVLGATAAFLIARSFGRAWVEARVRHHPAFRAIDRAVAIRGFRTVLLLRMSPVLPFNLLNYALGLTSVRLRDYVLATTLGMIPFSLLVVHAGSLATSLTGLSEAAPQGRLRVAMIIAGVVSLLIVVVMTGRAARRALKEHLDEESA